LIQLVEGDAFGEQADARSRVDALFPLRIFPKWLRRYAQEVAASCEIPVSIVGFGIMGMLSASYGMHVQVAIKNRYVPYCHDWFFLVAKVSLGKSPVFGHLAAPMWQIQKLLRDVIAEEKEQKSLRTIIQDSSPEAMNDAQGNNGGAVALVSPETTLLSQMSSTVRPIPLQPYLSSHTGEGYDLLRITRETKAIDRARLAIFACTQEAGLREILNRPEIISKGIVARCTFYVAPDITEDDFRDDDPEVTEELALRYEQTLRELGMRYRGEDADPLLFSSEAREARRLWRNRFKRRHRLAGGDLHDLSAHCSKLEDKLCRWTGLLHVLWCDEENRAPGVISIEDWDRALTLLEFDLHHYRAAMNVIQEGPAEALANKLEQWLRGRRGEIIRLRDLRRLVRAFKRADGRIQDGALQELEDRGAIQLVESSQGTKPSPAIEVL
jgi:hypothetical protein